MDTASMRASRMRRARKTAALVLTGATIMTAGSVVTSGPARAACTKWSYNGTFNVHQDNELRVQITGWSGTEVGGAQAALFLADGTPAKVDIDTGQPVQHGAHSTLNHETDLQQAGPVSGDIEGNQIHFTVDWVQLNPVVSNRYTGTIADNGVGAKGSTTNSAGASNTWFSTEPFTCAA